MDIRAFEAQIGSTAVRVTPFDFDCDGQADISVFRPTNSIWYFNGSQSGFSAAQFGVASDKLLPVDYDSDGKADIAVFRAGVRYIRQTSGSINYPNFGLSGDVPPNRFQ